MINLEKILPVLKDGHVDFVIIGGVAAVAHGSAHVTVDLDICYARTRENLSRLVQALAPYNPRLRLRDKDDPLANLPFIWDVQTLRNGSNFTLKSDLGDIDLLGEITGLGSFEKIVADAIPMNLFGVECLVLSLEKLIVAKQAAGRKKDLLMLPELQGLLELQQEAKEQLPE